jgi:hypothetical protein
MLVTVLVEVPIVKQKQPKLYLRWHRDRYYPVAAQIRAVLPRFRHLTDQEVESLRMALV